METTASTLNGVEVFFLVCAGAGGVFFLIRLALQLLGAHGDVDVHTDVDTDCGDAGHADADSSFKILTLQGVTAFFMMFGLVGFAFYRQSKVGAALSVLGAFAAGVVSVWVVGKLFESAKKLQSSGTLNAVSATGCEGSVYLTIPANGTGRVTINFKNRLREFDAVAQSKEEMKTGTQIRVVWVNGNTLVVEKI